MGIRLWGKGVENLEGDRGNSGDLLGVWGVEKCGGEFGYNLVENFRTLILKSVSKKTT